MSNRARILGRNWTCVKVLFGIEKADQLNQHRASASERVYTLLRSHISDGTLPSAAKLPSTRALAADLGVSRSTVVAVYEQLAAEGYIATAPGARARVAPGVSAQASVARTVHPRTTAPSVPAAARTAHISRFATRLAGLPLPQPPEAPQDGRIDFLYGALSSSDFPGRAWRRAYADAMSQQAARLYYRPADGEAMLLSELQGYLRRARGVVCTPEQILIVQGSQQAIDLCARVLVDTDDTVVIEEPCYLMARRVFEAARARLHTVAVDEHGMVTQALPRGRAQLVYVTPSHQFPLGGVMPIGRRRELLAWAQARNTWILEDDYDGEFRYGMPPVDTLQSLDACEKVIYVGTFSKTLSPQLRLGYLVLPTALVPAFRQAKQITDRHAQSVDQRALATLIRSGLYERHVRRMRRANERRRRALIDAIEQHLGSRAQVEGAASGLHLVLWLPGIPVQDEPVLVEQARACGVGVWPVSPLYAAGRALRARRCAGLVMGYASLEPAQITAGIERLAVAVAVTSGRGGSRRRGGSLRR